jgi:hypothetical protein
MSARSWWDELFVHPGKLGIRSPDRARFRDATAYYDVIYHFWFALVTRALTMIHILGKVSRRSGEKEASHFMPQNAGIEEAVLAVEKDGGCGRRDLQRSLIVVAATNWQTRELALAPSFC